MSAKKLRPHLYVDFTISVRGEEDGKCEVSFYMKTDKPQVWIMETLLAAMKAASEKLEENLGSLND